MTTEAKFGHLPYTFSLAERDRRWAATREMMARRGFDAIIVPCNTGHNEAYQADLRYLTQVGGFANEGSVFFPATGEPTVWVRADSQPAQYWLDMLEWPQDIRGSNCTWSENFADSIREHKLESGRIGVSGLDGTPRSPDGTILYGTLNRLQEWFPKATFEGATVDMVNVRLVKSDEEIMALERATEIAEQALLAGAAAMKPGMSDHEVYAEVVYSMLKNQGELPTMLLWEIGAAPARRTRIPAIREIQMGDLILNETEAKFAGYICQIRHPVFLGGLTTAHQHLYDAALECFEAMFDAVKPGATYGDLKEIYTTVPAQRGYRPGRVFLHGRGLGEDLPVLGIGNEDRELWQTPMRAGQVFIMGPPVTHLDSDIHLAWGDMVTVTETGARRLGKLGTDPIIAKG